MFVYPRKDESFVEAVSKFCLAGVDNEERCVCCVDSPVRERIIERMAQLGASPETEFGSGPMAVYGSSDVYMHGGIFDLVSVIRFWRENLEIARSKWNGLRIFGDVESVIMSRSGRLKLLEYEALANLDFPASIALCGYQSSLTATRSFLLQVRSVHPFIANSSSIKRNNTFLSTGRFLAGFYRFRRVCRSYPATFQNASAMRQDLEEVAVRTRLTLPQIEELRGAASEAFVNAVEHGCGNDASAKVSVAFVPDFDRFLVIVRDRGVGFRPGDPATADEGRTRRRGMRLIRAFADEVRVERRGGQTIVTIAKKYPSFA
jgi:anti-sigma regulatory factor (Ser/Thr protein kinase)